MQLVFGPHGDGLHGFCGGAAIHPIKYTPLTKIKLLDWRLEKKKHSSE
jgi:hypothetical protein